ncbi:MAG: hypothetical protein LQ337_004855 [Flavoplaca oasis]|nr:MAG: hypothetical protein LQ337_004855 [Flavoplaca oasis]
MKNTHTPRRVLQNLPVNAFGTPTSSHANLKRQIHEVQDPNLPPSPLRSRPSDHSLSLSLEPTRETEPQPGVTPNTLSRTTPQDDRDEMVEESTQDTSKGTGSESVYSDMEGDTTNTQQTAATETSLPTEIPALSRAEMLCLRLRVALFKVQTDQINIPVSQLRLPTTCFPELKPPPQSSSKRADVQPPSLLPAPNLKATVRPNERARYSQMLSSPPSTRAGSPTKVSDSDNFRTPLLPLSKVQQSHQLSSPPNSHDGDLKDSELEDGRLSSSAVKGNAAISLLGLRDDRR